MAIDRLFIRKIHVNKYKIHIESTTIIYYQPYLDLLMTDDLG